MCQASRVPRRALSIVLLFVFACDSGGGTKDATEYTGNEGSSTGGSAVIDVGTGGTAEADTGPTQCSPCRYCGVVASYSANSQGEFVQANVVDCTPANCDENGEPECYVDPPMTFIASFSKCTRFQELCPGDHKFECEGKAQKCGHQVGLSTECSDTEFCDQSTGTWKCPYGYSTGICANGF